MRTYGRMTATHAVLMTLALSLVSGAPLLAQQTAPAAPRAAAESDSHPFFQWNTYPAWSQLTAEQATNDIRRSMELAKARIAAICNVTPAESSFENTFGAYEKATHELDVASSLLHHLSSTMDSKALRDAQEQLTPELSAFSAALIANEQLWKVISESAQQAWVRDLSPAKQRYVQQVVDSFRDSGAALSPEQKKRKAEIALELSTLTLKFSKNVLDSTNAWKLVISDKSRLAGVSEDWLARAAEAAQAEGFGTPDAPQWLITLQYPSYSEIMKNCDVEETRRLCWEGRNTVGNSGEYDNEAIVARVMELRRELATLLGFGTFADMKAARRMVGSGSTAIDFVDSMMHKVKPTFDREVQEMLSYVSRKKGRTITAMNPWDVQYYSRQLSNERFDLDYEDLRPYYQYENVYRGMFRIFENLLGITITELPVACIKPGETLPEGAIEVWHPEVQLFKVCDKKTGAHLGSFYLDPFPRDSKRAGAWVMPMNYGTPAANGQPHAPHLACICGNFNAPVGDKPALLSQLDVTTLFHEFGHMMHCMMGDTELSSHCGTSVSWDFVEQPSQMFENWAWEPEGLAQFAFHYQTGELMPQDMQQKLNAGRFFMPATDNMNQLCVAKLDLDMHVNYDEKYKGRSIDTATQELLAPWRMPYTVTGPSIMRTLTHCINGGYAAGYYSYKWAEVLAADGFSRFKAEGIMNTSTGASYRETILSKGDSADPNVLFRNFVGREPNPDALLQQMGLK